MLEISTFQDQKILELMLAKREEERKLQEQRDAAKRAWEQEKKQEQAIRGSTEIVRRRSMIEGHKRKESYRVC